MDHVQITLASMVVFMVDLVNHPTKHNQRWVMICGYNTKQWNANHDITILPFTISSSMVKHKLQLGTGGFRTAGSPKFII